MWLFHMDLYIFTAHARAHVSCFFIQQQHMQRKNISIGELKLGCKDVNIVCFHNVNLPYTFNNFIV